MARINWDAVKNDYLYGAFLKEGQFRPYTNKEIASKHGCKENTLNVKITIEGWGDIKRQIWAEIAKRVHEDKQTGAVNAVLEFDNTAFSIACNSVKILESKQYIKKEIKGADGNVYYEYTLNTDMSVIEIRRLLEATNLAINVRQSMMGDVRANPAEDSINELVRIIQMERMNSPSQVIDVRASNRGREKQEAIDTNAV